MGGRTRINKQEKDPEPILLMGGNPQIAKADGDLPVQAYIAAMPGWKRAVGRRLDALIVSTVPNLCKAIKWNTPFYGVARQGWFVTFHCFKKFIKVGFFRGSSLTPLPPQASKQKDVRYWHIYEDDEIDEKRFKSWILQAAVLPGWNAEATSSGTDAAYIPNPNVSRYLGEKATWQDELTALRAILVDCKLTEDWKWNKPCYTFQGGSVVAIARLKNHCWLMFFRGALLADPADILKKPGENSDSMRVIPFTSVRDIAERSAVLKTYVKEAMELQRAGRKVDFKKRAALPAPDELLVKLKEVPELQTAFYALTPGRQRGYLLHFSAAKQSKTRTSRIEKCIPKIMKGQGLQDR